MSHVTARSKGLSDRTAGVSVPAMALVFVDRRSALDPIGLSVLGGGLDPMQLVEERARQAYPGVAVIAWEGDAATFQFTYVSRAAEEILGYPVERWTSEPSFWSDQVIVPEDSQEAVAYCALATAGRRDHVFEYRARSASGKILVLRDLVRVILGPKGLAERLRGLMFDVSEERSLTLRPQELRARENPSRDELHACVR